MFRCETCKSEVEIKPVLKDEFDNEFEICNKCGDENCFIETKECSYCQTKMIPEENKFCDSCKKHIQEHFKELLRKNYKAEEINYIDEFIEGRYLKDIIGYGDEN
jgi:hypothetical protein